LPPTVAAGGGEVLDDIPVLDDMTIVEPEGVNDDFLALLA